MCGTSALLLRNTPVRLISSTCFQSARGYSQVVVLGPVIPALQTRTSTRPRSRTVSSRARHTSVSSLTSTRRVWVCPPIAFAPAASALSSRSHRLTRAPEAARRCAIAKPMPAAPPVMTALRPFRSSWFIDPPRWNAEDNSEGNAAEAQDAVPRAHRVVERGLVARTETQRERSHFLFAMARCVVRNIDPRRSVGLQDRARECERIGVRVRPRAVGHREPRGLTVVAVGEPEREDRAGILVYGDAPAVLREAAPPEIFPPVDRVRRFNGEVEARERLPASGRASRPGCRH